MVLSEYSVKAKIGKIFLNERILEEYYTEIYETDPYFYKNCNEKIKVDKNGHKYILFRIDVYFSEYNLAVEVDEKGHTYRDLIFQRKRQYAKENSVVNFLELVLIKEIRMYFMKVVECKYLLVSLK